MEKETLTSMPVEEKLKLLTDLDKEYLKGYIDRALIEKHKCTVTTAEQKKDKT